MSRSLLGSGAERDRNWSADDVAQPRIHLIELATGTVGETLVGPQAFTASVRFSPDGKTLAVGSGEPSRSGEIKLFNLTDVQYETALLLSSSLTFGFALISATRNKTGLTLLWLAVTFALGAGFLYLEMHEFAHLIAEGAGPGRSAFWSAFFTLVGTHGLHVTIGMIWMLVLMVQMVLKTGTDERRLRRLACLSLFWHFLDIVWICVFSFVYLASVV